MSNALAIQSAKFHAFEWLRSEAIKGNKHAEILVVEHARLPCSPSTSRCVPEEEVGKSFEEGFKYGQSRDAGRIDECWERSRAKQVAGGKLQ